MRVGIPRALLYHKYYPAWERFFKELGAEVIVSPSTNKRILQLGLELAENELCLPVKVFYGHAMHLKDQVDFLFIPRMVAVEKKEYTCPKFLGLPDMIQALDEAPPVLSPTVNWNLGRKIYYKTVLEVGERFTSDRLRIARAYMAAMRELRRHERTERSKRPRGSLRQPGRPLRIGLAGHPYNLHDEFVSLKLVERLEKRGVELLTAEMLTRRQIERAAKRAPKDLFWSYEKEVLGATYHWIGGAKVDGIIYVIAFPCGPDSTIQVLIERQAKRAGVPLMSLILDEHSAEAGLITRIEAFVDLLQERHRRRSGIPQIASA